jgi:antitoxin ParD1/3/4
MNVTLNIAITQKMRDYIELQIAEGDFASASEYIRSLIRADSQKQLETLLIEGEKSGVGLVMDDKGRKEFSRRMKLRTRRAS